ncbi:MAG TPA: hypothetical protein EYG91_04595 [Aquifex aeolicus]|nr:hypothetical protein [Aquifex aeolicus]
MTNYILSLYAGSLFLLVFVIFPVLLKTPLNKDIVGYFYGKILWSFYRIFFILLFIYAMLFNFSEGFILLIGLSINVLISKKLKELKREIGSIESLDFNHPKRVKFRKFSYTSLSVLFINFVISSLILITNLRGG